MNDFTSAPNAGDNQPYSGGANGAFAAEQSDPDARAVKRGEEAFAFLKMLRPGGPWLLLAIEPEPAPGKQPDIIGNLCRTVEEVARFVSKHNGTNNIYYSLNPTRKRITKKPKKTDLAAIEYLPSDLDPKTDETPDAAKLRYIAEMGLIGLVPTAIIDSGNGLNVILKLQDPISLPKPEPVEVVRKSGTSQELRFPPEIDQQIADVEARAKALMEKLGSVAGTQNIDRILRLPGTTNIPNKVKREAGRVRCEASLVVFNDAATVRLEDLPEPPPKQKRTGSKAPEDPSREDPAQAQGSRARAAGDNGNTVLPKSAVALLKIPDKGAGVPYGTYQSRSGLLFAFLLKCLKAGVAEYRIRETSIYEPEYANSAIRAHCDEQGDADSYLDRQIERAVKWLENPPARDGEPAWAEVYENGAVRATLRNARIAITYSGIKCSLNTFQNRMFIGRSDAAAPSEPLLPFFGRVTDAAIGGLRVYLANRFDRDFTEKHVRDAVSTLATENSFNLVVDMLAEAQRTWDGVARLDRFAPDYLNVDDTELHRQFGRKFVIAAVARARRPGCKFDTMLVLESPEGWNKSSVWALIAGEGNFSDEKIIGKESREVQEQLEGVWIHENAEFAGLRKAEIETVKAYCSRQADRARPAFGHFLEDKPRCSVEVGTTNDIEWLLSQNGNRRFWPMKVFKPIDLAKVRVARLQLLGEAAFYQSQGESLVLPQELWAEAGRAQEERRVKHPWEDVLRPWLTFMESPAINRAFWNGDKTELRITTVSLFDILKIEPIHQSPYAKQLADVMRVMDWEPSRFKKRGRGYKRSVAKIEAEMAAEIVEEEAEATAKSED